MNKDSVFGKTSKGVQEVSNRTLDLNMSIRSALIMVDGKTPVGVLAGRYAQIGIKDTMGALQALEELGLITLLKAGANKEPTTPTRTSTGKGQNLDTLKKSVATVIEEYFGFMATPHLNRLARCNTHGEVIAHVAQCQNVIKEAFNVQKAESFKHAVDDILS